MVRTARLTTRATTARFFVHVLVSLTLSVLSLACDEEAIAPPPTPPVAAQVVVQPNGHIIRVGDRLTFTTRIFDNTGVELLRPVTWSTSDPNVASVSSEGVVTGLAEGPVSIRAALEGVTGSAHLDVITPIIASLTIGVSDSVALELGETRTLSATVRDTSGRVVTSRAVTWGSSDASVVSVGVTGAVTAHALGNAEVTATVDEIIARVSVNVTPPAVATLSVSPSPFTIEIGETHQLQAQLKDRFGNVIPDRPVLWTSINEAVRIDNSGLVTGLQGGQVTIIATSEGKSAIVNGTIVAAAPYGYDLVYDRVTSGGQSELFLLDLTSGGAPFRLNAGSVSRSPTPSPDGSRIAFAVSQLDLTTGQRLDDIFVVDRTGMNMQRLTTASGIDEAPAWSPTSARIAYQHWDPAGRSDIWIMDEDGSNATNLTAELSAFAFRSGASWSRDGSRIAFVQTETIGSATTTSIWLMRPDGSQKVELTSSTTAFFGAPTWSPDGTRLAFVRHYPDESDITIMNVNDGTTTRLRIAGYEESPAWSPDGTLIAFTSGWAIYTVRPDGSNLRLRTVDPQWGAGVSAAWIVRQ